MDHHVGPHPGFSYGRLPDELLRFGIQLADGTKATTVGSLSFGELHRWEGAPRGAAAAGAWWRWFGWS